MPGARWLKYLELAASVNLQVVFGEASFGHFIVVYGLFGIVVMVFHTLLPSVLLKDGGREHGWVVEKGDGGEAETLVCACGVEGVGGERGGGSVYCCKTEVGKVWGS